jgi:hypothetical protein
MKLTLRGFMQDFIVQRLISFDLPVNSKAVDNPAEIFISRLQQGQDEKPSTQSAVTVLKRMDGQD